MSQSLLSVRINSTDKLNFEKFCKDTGMNVSVAINLFIKTVLREQKLPFEIKSSNNDLFIYEKLKEAENEIENNVNKYTAEEVSDSVRKITNNV